MHKVYSASTAVKITFKDFPDTPPGLHKLHMTFTVVSTAINIPPHTQTGLHKLLMQDLHMW